MIRQFLYADDKYFLAHTVDDMQHIVDIFEASCTTFRFKISLTKQNNVYLRKLTITVHGTKLAVAETFIHLRSTLTKNGYLDAKMYLSPIGCLENGYRLIVILPIKLKEMVISLAC